MKPFRPYCQMKGAAYTHLRQHTTRSETMRRGTRRDGRSPPGVPRGFPTSIQEQRCGGHREHRLHSP
ncbi:GGDEF domain protein [Burkholderia mallei]|nr:GGDEF domain protein [Burkholderia pseudomallei]KGW97966.1 GGDEF domain protein [Burkholderia pseudomallei MSHR332]KOS98692.1 GGDEF domain protein [Burkholderia mallei]KGD54268.1 GGDEF domain protein [Burkholderia pseudomallei]KOT10947.1 GGDEF domain protein [Burkholderia mallei]